MIASIVVMTLFLFYKIASNRNIDKFESRLSQKQNGGLVSSAAGSGSLSEQSGSAAREPVSSGYFLSARPIESGFMQYNRVKVNSPLPQSAPEVKRYPGPLEAKSPEDAVWLDRMGYPTQDELESLDGLSESSLATRSSEGDLASMALLGEKQIRDGKIAEGYSNLQDSAMLGSVWAILRLADHQKSIGNIGDAIALYNLASMRGDLESARLGLLEGLPPELHQSQVVRVPTRTALFLASMQRIRASRGLPPLVFDLRPQQSVLPGHGGMIGIYPRSRKSSSIR